MDSEARDPRFARRMLVLRLSAMGVMAAGTPAVAQRAGTPAPNDRDPVDAPGGSSMTADADSKDPRRPWTSDNGARRDARGRVGNVRDGRGSDPYSFGERRFSDRDPRDPGRAARPRR